MSGSPLYLKQLEVGPMANFIYLIGDTHTRECVIVDPAWDVPSVIREAEKDGIKVIGGLITHTHYDHCNNTEKLIEMTQGKVYVNKHEAEFLKGMKGHLQKVDSGDKIKVGGIEITFLHTPGHTPGSQCFLVQERLVSGDTLFINACGRCDLPGGNAEEMYRSLQQLAKLEDTTILLPGHNYADYPTSTIGGEKHSNPYYQAHSLQDFLRLRVR